MSRRASAEPLRKITLDVFAADHEFLKRAHGYGLAAVIRELIRGHVRAVKLNRQIEDLVDE